jgi:zinc transport system substrate-binding protein
MQAFPHIKDTMILFRAARRSVFFGLALWAVLSVYGGLSHPPGKVRIVATVFPLAEFAREIGGGRVEVHLLLPPGADVHTWQPRVSDIRRLETADLLVFIGQGLEPWLTSLLKGANPSRLARFEAAFGRKLLPAAPDGEDHDHGAFDPHIWLDFRMDQDLADGIAAALARLDPAGAPDFLRGAGNLKDRLKSLDAAYEAGLKDCRGREFILGGHAAFAYLARRYGLRQVAVYGASPDAAPTPKGTAAVIARAAKEGIQTIFYEPSLGDKMARLIAAEIGAKVRILYPAHNLSPEQAAAGETFFRLMETNLENLKNGLGCR